MIINEIIPVDIHMNRQPFYIFHRALFIELSRTTSSIIIKNESISQKTDKILIADYMKKVKPKGLDKGFIILLQSRNKGEIRELKEFIYYLLRGI